jgi:hypothetical protein
VEFLALAGLLVLVGGNGGWSQQINCTAGSNCTATTIQSPGSGRQSGSQTQVSPNVTAPESPLDSRLEQDQAKMRNLDRQKKLVDDTAKLVSLANELKADVDKSNKDTMSLDVIRKADEIEKLAHSVKEKMKGT